MEAREERLGNIYGHEGGSYAGQVFKPEGVCPTLTDMQGGGQTATYSRG